MTLEQVYAAIGGDYKGVMERLPSADFVRRFALKFLQDDSFPNLKKALEAQDAPTAFRAAHTLKGVCQNHGFDALYATASALTEARRGGKLDGAQGVPEDMLLQAGKFGVCKINIDTDLRLAMTASIRKHLVENPGDFDPRQYLKPARQAIQDMVAHKMRDVLNSSNRL